MNFKTNWSFLEKISMGAVGTHAVINELNGHGNQVIELERYCMLKSILENLNIEKGITKFDIFLDKENQQLVLKKCKTKEN